MKKLPFKQQIADLALLLKRHGVHHAVICPGSRNAPLTQVFQRDTDFNCFSIVDERSAGYVALGIARQTCRAVAVITTSGTAALNLAPAVAEAYFQKLPLVVITADRPPEWPPQFGNQRINQLDIFKSNVKGSYNLPMEPMSKDDARQAIRQVSEIIGTALSAPKGPVHLNVPLNEPLYETVAGASDAVRKMPAPMVVGNGSGNNTLPLPETESRIISTALSSQKKVLMIAGMNAYSKEEREALILLTMHCQVTIIAENITNLAADTLVPDSGPGQKNHPNTNNATTSELPDAASGVAPATAGQLISLPELAIASANEEELKNLQPELVISFGGHVVSKKMRLFVQGLINVPVIATERPPVKLFHQILSETSSQKTGHPTATTQFSSKNSAPVRMTREPSEEKKPSTEISSSSKNTREPSDNLNPTTHREDQSSLNQYLSAWKKQETTALQRTSIFFTMSSFSNLTATAAILSQVPPTTTVHLGNSGTIRYSQLSATRNDLTYYSNRGTSGIDGSLSAAVGAAMVSPGPHLAILGDLSFVYDSNALWNKNFPKNLKIIVLNDRGGGIFRLLDGPSRMPFFGEFSVTNHPVDLQHLAEAFGLKHLYVSDMIGLKTALASLFSGDTGPALLEVNTAKSENSAIFKQFFKSLRNE